MKLSVFDQKFFRRIFSASVETVLHFLWWAVVFTLLILLFADGLIFYNYGLGFAVAPPIPDDTVFARLREEILKNAASKLEIRRAEFETATTTPDGRNPFK